MSIFHSVFNIILHLDPATLSAFMKEYGFFAFIVMFLIIFCETGLVITPFLPGDSLIFAVGALVSLKVMAGWPILIALIAAAILGNVLNYRIGRLLSGKIINREKIKFIKMEYIDETHRFFEKYGASTIIITRFMPIIRTFTPFVAGVGEMPYGKFLIYNAIGGTAWACFFFLCGFFFGTIPAVSSHFSMVVMGIILVSLIPAVVIFLRKSLGKRKANIKKSEE